MTLNQWFFPNKTGDFRLERDGETTVLTVEDITDDDRRRLAPLLREARQEGWIDDLAGVVDGDTRLVLAAPLQIVGPRLAHALVDDVPTWTAVRYASGQVSLADGTELVLVAPAPVAAVTVKKPARGCPAPAPAPRRAGQVLRAFSTAGQWNAWVCEGSMRAIGNVTGHGYRIYHPSVAVARGHQHLLVREGTGHEICVWDGTVPAEEEVLAIKRAGEHRERWLLEDAQ